jgi:hypothetical protein
MRSSADARFPREGGLNRPASRDPLSKSSGLRSVWQRPSARARIGEKAGRLPTRQQRATAEKAVSLAGGEEERPRCLRRDTRIGVAAVFRVDAIDALGRSAEEEIAGVHCRVQPERILL